LIYLIHFSPPHYLKPNSFLLLAFLARFSERRILGMLETIVGMNLQESDEATAAQQKTTKAKG
jgi:hypothetical protein